MVDIFQFAKDNNVEVRISFNTRTERYMVELSRDVHHVIEQLYYGYDNNGLLDDILKSMVKRLEKMEEEHQLFVAEMRRRIDEKKGKRT